MSAVREMPALGSVDALPKHQLRVTWLRGSREGRVDVVDVSPMVFSFRVFKSLRSKPKLWQTARVAMFGNAVAWDGDIDMSAESNEYLAAEAVTSEDFRGFLVRCSLTQEAAAHALGRSRRQIASYLSGAAIPRVVALACIAYEARHTVSPLTTMPIPTIDIRSNMRPVTDITSTRQPYQLRTQSPPVPA
jgi:hypothetical protein